MKKPKQKKKAEIQICLGLARGSEFFDQIGLIVYPNLFFNLYLFRNSRFYQMFMNDKEISVSFTELLVTPIRPLSNHINECMSW